jgi:IS4 transposase
LVKHSSAQDFREWGFFLSRVKGNVKLTVTEVVHGIGQAIVGSDLRSFLIKRCRKTIVEITVTMNINDTKTPFRVLGFWHKKDKCYRWYITNLTCDRKLIYDLYRLRWQIELSFKAMKSTLNFDRMPTLNQNAVTSFTLIALINYVFATFLREEARSEAVKKGHSGAESSSIQRATKLFSKIADIILDLIKLGRRLTKKVIKNLAKTLLPFLSDVLDPNYKSRETTLGRLQADSGEKSK